MNIVCLNSSIMFAEYSTNVAKRSEGRAVFELPIGWETNELHFWIFMSSKDFQEYSDSFYVVR